MAIINNPAVNRCKYLFELEFSFPSAKYPEVELLDHMVVLFLVFWGIFILFSIMATPVYILTYICYCLFGNSHSNRCEVVPLISDVYAPFQVPVGHVCWYVCLGKMSVQILCLFFNEIVSFLLLGCMSSLYILEINSFQIHLCLLFV